MIQTISQTFKNFAGDNDFTAIIPRGYVALEVVAAASVIAKELAGKDEPDRHHYLKAVPLYLASLPQSIEAAVGIVKLDAAAVLNIPGIATDAEKLAQAQARLASAQAEVESAEVLQGKRLAAIYRHEADLSEANRELEAWQIDLDAEVAEAETAILENWGKCSVVGRLNDLAHVPILRKLQPIALKGINSRIAEATAALAVLHAPESNRKPKL